MISLASDWRGSATQSLRAFAMSRLVVVAGGTAGALIEPRMRIWYLYDPLRVSSSLGSVGNVLAATAVRWDAIHYLLIAQHGYAGSSETVFYPLYPLLIRIFSLVLGSEVLAGMLISAVSFCVALTLLHRLTELELSRSAADATVLLLAFAPLSFFFTAVYTESLFLALSVGAVYAARCDRWALAGILAALSAVTRVPGILIVVLLACLYVRQSRHLDRLIAWLLLAPLALGSFLAYLAARGYGWLAPIKDQTGPQYAHRLAGPLSTVISAIHAGVSGVVATIGGKRIFAPAIPLGPFSPQFQSVVLLAVLVLATAALAVAFRRLPAAYGVYSLLVLLVCVYSPTVNQPLQALDRYTLTIFPLWMAAGDWLCRRRAVVPTVLLGACLLAFYAFEAATWIFIA